MVLQVFADTWQIRRAGDAVFLQLRGGADTREHQQFRRIIGAGSDEHFAAGARGLEFVLLQVFDANGAAVFLQDPRDQRIGDDGQVRIVEDLGKEGTHGVAAFMLSDRVLHQADAELLLAVEIRVVGDSAALDGEHEGVCHLGRVSWIRYPKAAFDAMVFRRYTLCCVQGS